MTSKTIIWALAVTAACWVYSTRDVSLRITPETQFEYQGDFTANPKVVKTLFIDSGRYFCHSASLMTLPEENNPKFRAVAAFLAGSYEGASDVEIMLSFYDGDKWSAPLAIISSAELSGDTGRWVGKVGNPVLVTDQMGRWHLFVVGAIGGWSSASIYHTYSVDSGQSWSRAKMLELSPFFGISNLVRAAPLDYGFNGFLLPVYHEMLLKYPTSAIVSYDGTVRSQSLIPTDRKNLQPSFVSFGTNNVGAFMRDTAMDGSGRVGVAHSFDCGKSWQKSPPLEILNFDTPPEVLRFDDQTLIMAGNGPTKGRVELNLFLSTDNGRNWRRYFRLEWGGAKLPDGKYPMFTYPSLRRLDAKTLALSYTWNRSRIKYLEIEIPQKEIK